MKSFKALYLVGTIVMAIAAGTVAGYSKEKPAKPEKKGNPGGQTSGHNGGGGGQTNSASGNGPGNGRRNGGAIDNTTPSDRRTGQSSRDSEPKPQAVDKGSSNAKPAQNSTGPTLKKHETANGYEETTPSGKVRTRDETKPDGEHVTKFTETGR
jgi:hypothetical protein